MSMRISTILPPQIRVRLSRFGDLIIQGHKAFQASRAPKIDINRYWELTGPDFERGKLLDVSLVPHISRFLDLIPDQASSILDVGCGIGRTYDLLSSRGYTNYNGIDICQSSIEDALTRHPGVRFINESLLSYEPGRVFDSAIATDVLLYLSPLDQIRALLKMRSIIKPEVPVLIRWAAGNNNVEIKSKKVGNETVEGWVFLIDLPYLEQLLRVMGFDLDRYDLERVRLSDGRILPYHIAIVHSFDIEG